MTEEMAGMCSNDKCCDGHSYKKCTTIRCESSEDRVQCEVTDKKIKSLDCLCPVYLTNCNSDGFGEAYGTDTDDSKHYLWVDNGCRGTFRVCFHRENKPKCTSDIISTKSIETSTVVVRRPTSSFSSRRTTSTQSLTTTKDPPNTLSMKDEVNWKGYLAIIPIILILIGIIVAVLSCMRKRRNSKRKLESDNRMQQNNYTETIRNPADDEVYTEIRDDAVFDLPEKRKSNTPIYNICSENQNNPSKNMENFGNGNYQVIENENVISADRNRLNYAKPSAPPPEYFVPLDNITFDQDKMNSERYSTPFNSKETYFVLEKEDVNSETADSEKDATIFSSNTGDVNYFVLEK